jgi:hypothetical protein
VKESTLSSNYNKMPEIVFKKLDHEKKNQVSTKRNNVGECKCISEGWAEVYIRRPFTLCIINVRLCLCTQTLSHLPQLC